MQRGHLIVRKRHAERELAAVADGVFVKWQHSLIQYFHPYRASS